MSKVDEINPICDKCNKPAEFVSEEWAYCKEHAEKAKIFDWERNYKPINKCRESKPIEGKTR